MQVIFHHNSWLSTKDNESPTKGFRDALNHSPSFCDKWIQKSKVIHSEKTKASCADGQKKIENYNRMVGHSLED